MDYIQSTRACFTHFNMIPLASSGSRGGKQPKTIYESGPPRYYHYYHYYRC